MDRRQLVAVATILMLVFVALVLFVVVPSGRVDDSLVGDEHYLSIARLTPEGRQFLAAYPMAKLAVDRSGALAVDFRASDPRTASGDQAGAGIRLRVFIDAVTDRAIGALVECDRTLVEDDVSSYLSRYEATRRCQ